MNDVGNVLSIFLPTTNSTLKSIFIPIFRKFFHVTGGFVIMNWAENQSNHHYFSLKRGAIKADCIYSNKWHLF